jgi:hypothetical protein
MSEMVDKVDQLKKAIEEYVEMIKIQSYTKGATDAVEEMRAKVQPDQPAPLPDGYRLATEWERKNLPYPEGVEVLYASTRARAIWCNSNNEIGWRNLVDLIFAVPFPERPEREWLDKRHFEIVGDWPTNEFVVGDLWKPIIRDDDWTRSMPVSFATHSPNKGAFDGCRYKLRWRKPLLKDHNPPTFDELSKEEQLELCEAILDDPAGVVYRARSGEWKRCHRATGAVSFGSTTVYALASQFDLTDSGVDEK